MLALLGMKKGVEEGRGGASVGGEGENGMKYPEGGVETEFSLEKGDDQGRKGYTDLESALGAGAAQSSQIGTSSQKSASLESGTA